MGGSGVEVDDGSAPQGVTNYHRGSEPAGSGCSGTGSILCLGRSIGPSREEQP